MYRNGEEVNADSFPDNTLTISSDDEQSTYEFTVNGEKSSRNGATADDNDDISGDTVSG